MLKNKSVLLAIYHHPDHYPPTTNTVHVLAGLFGRFFLLHRPKTNERMSFPGNVEISNWRQLEPANPNLFRKVAQFLSFCWKFRALISRKRPELIIVHDILALYALHLVLKTIRSDAKLWYHNHDVPEIELIRKYSIGWFAAKVDSKIFPRLDLFSIPSEARKSYFPLHLLKNKVLTIPNYPLLSDRSLQKASPPDKVIKIIFQGRITANRGIEEAIELLKSGIAVAGKEVQLVLLGSIDPLFRGFLSEQTSSFHLGGKLQIKDPVSSGEVIKETLACQVGLAGLKPVGINYQTAGTASNKIYEYASCGMPVIYFDTPHYRKHLGQYAWAFGGDLSVESMEKHLSYMVSHYQELSVKAQSDFEQFLNYESAMKPTIDFWEEKLFMS